MHSFRRGSFPFGDYLSYSNASFTLEEVKSLWSKNKCTKRYGRPLTVRIDHFLKPAESNVLCSDWTLWKQPVIWWVLFFFSSFPLTRDFTGYLARIACSSKFIYLVGVHFGFGTDHITRESLSKSQLPSVASYFDEERKKGERDYFILYL